MRGRLVALTEQDIESELSYAYLHAVVSRAGGHCEIRGRHADNRGIDATMTLYQFDNPGVLQEVTLNVQLKSTLRNLAETADHFSYFLNDTAAYDLLRAEVATVPRLLVLLRLPDDRSRWLGHSIAELSLRNCCYWLSLAGAGPSANATGETVYFPKANVLNVEALLSIGGTLSRREDLRYEPPTS